VKPSKPGAFFPRSAATPPPFNTPANGSSAHKAVVIGLHQRIGPTPTDAAPAIRADALDMAWIGAIAGSSMKVISGTNAVQTKKCESE
jgi:hypothetical protein